MVCVKFRGHVLTEWVLCASTLGVAATVMIVGANLPQYFHDWTGQTLGAQESSIPSTSTNLQVASFGSTTDTSGFQSRPGKLPIQGQGGHQNVDNPDEVGGVIEGNIRNLRGEGLPRESSEDVTGVGTVSPRRGDGQNSSNSPRENGVRSGTREDLSHFFDADNPEPTGSPITRGRGHGLSSEIAGTSELKSNSGGKSRVTEETSPAQAASLHMNSNLQASP